MKKMVRLVFACLALFALSGVGKGQPPAHASVKAHRVVFELSTDHTPSWNALLNNVENVQAHFGAANTEIEVVAHGPGIGLVLKSNPALADRMEALSKQKVVFAACNNTLTRKKIPSEDLLPFVTVVPAGVAEVILKQEAGWAYVKAGIQ